MEYYSAIKEWNLAICDNMDGPWGQYAKWNNLNRERQTPYDLTYMWNLKQKQKLSSNVQRTDWWLPEVQGGLNGWRGSKGTNF